ncbi:MAG: 50S ribosomal protein L10 [candidate division NC10 bacterium]|nr:50S ribosomal protein L10 [candidate division NC10 bacterium]
MGRDGKSASIAALKERLTGAQSAILTDFRGLSVADLTELRTLLRKSAVEYRVVKNTLARIAVRETALAGLNPYLEGPTGIAISTKDPVAASKILTTWAKGKPTFAIKAGVVEGQIVGPAEIAVLGDLPPREALLSRLASAFQGPIQRTAGVLAAPLRAMVTVLARVGEHKDTAGAA